METLFERLSGIGLSEGSGKIGVHSFYGALYEYGTGNLIGGTDGYAAQTSDLRAAIHGIIDEIV